MSSQTPNINLTLPVGSEKVSRQIINENNTKIDTAIGSLNDSIANKIKAKTYTQTTASGAFFIDLPSGVTTNGYAFIAQPMYESGSYNFYTITLQPISGNRCACYIRQGSVVPPDGSTITFMLVCIKV